jgi:hypothetical protein
MCVNHSRPTSITYPNGKVLTSNYKSGLDDRISRLSSLSDSSGARVVPSAIISPLKC